MNLIQFFNSNSSSGASLRAVKPIIFQESLTIAAGAGLIVQDLLPSLAVGDCAAYGGQIVNNGCYELLVSVEYLEGGTCDECVVGVLAPVLVEVYVPKNSVFPLPDGFFQRVQVQTVDATRTPINATTEVTVALHSSHTPNCGGCALAVTPL